MDLSVIVGIAVGIAAVWVLMLLVFWAVRPKGVSVKELVRIIPDVLRLLRSSSAIAPRRSTCESS